jgi:tetraacyldisaccharide 4'-kinase
MNPLGHGIIPDMLSCVYGAVVDVRNYFYDNFKNLSKPTGKPTIGVGGIQAGGTGKTPLTLLTCRYAVKKGYEVALLSRGYKRKIKKNIISAPHTVDSWEHVGDEPAMLHAAMPESWLGIGSNRLANISTLKSVIGKKAVFILDDSFQHRKVKRDVDIACLSPECMDDSLIPAGTLREKIRGLNRADCICLIGMPEESEKLSNSKLRINDMFPEKTVVVLHQVPACWIKLSDNTSSDNLPVKKPLVISGIARPERFFFLLKKMGISVSAQSIFNDHHEFKKKEIESIVNNQNIDSIITTEKDAFRLKTLKFVHKPDIWYLKIDLKFSSSEYEKIFNHVIDKALQ